MQSPKVEIVNPANLAAWRQWLQNNHHSASSVWLVFYKKASSKFSISWSEAVDVALCYGWIDSKKITIDDETSHQFFSKRKAQSTWSKINKEKVARLIESGQMTEAGLAAVRVAQQNGSWVILDAVEALHIPHDLEKAFVENPGSKLFFQGLSKSAKKAMLQWIVLAKQTGTKQARINHIAACAAQNKKPKQF